MMSNTLHILREIKQLPIDERLQIIEKAIQSIRMENKGSLQRAVNELYEDYKNDRELTIFTSLDQESFYEPR